MGVMLSLDRPPAARSRHRGQHVRNTDPQAREDVPVGGVRHDYAAGAGRYLGRLARIVLSGRPQPATMAGPAGPARRWKRRARRMDLALTVSVPCLLGHCRVIGDGPGCQSRGCGHDCHRR